MTPFTSTVTSTVLNKLAADLLLPQVLHAVLEVIINKALSFKCSSDFACSFRAKNTDA